MGSLQCSFFFFSPSLFLPLLPIIIFLPKSRTETAHFFYTRKIFHSLARAHSLCWRAVRLVNKLQLFFFWMEKYNWTIKTWPGGVSWGNVNRKRRIEGIGWDGKRERNPRETNGRQPRNRWGLRWWEMKIMATGWETGRLREKLEGRRRRTGFLSVWPER